MGGGRLSCMGGGRLSCMGGVRLSCMGGFPFRRETHDAVPTITCLFVSENERSTSLQVGTLSGHGWRNRCKICDR